MFQDRSPHQEQFVTVNGCSLHYLDWGGVGEPILFLPGLGDSAHVFDDIAPQFSPQFRVLALTRRGQGQSEKTMAGYTTESLADDIRCFLEVLQLERVILAGHSFAGSEMTCFAVQYPHCVSKLVYLDAAYDRADDERLELPIPYPSTQKQDLQSLDTYRAFLRRVYYDGIWSSALEANLMATIELAADGYVITCVPDDVIDALVQGQVMTNEFANLQMPILAFFAMKDKFPGLDVYDQVTQETVKRWLQNTLDPYLKRLVAEFRVKAPRATVIELSNTNHYCFVHREDAVVQAMQAFFSQ